MAVNMKTASCVVHKTTITADGAPRKDGGRQLLLDAFDSINEEGQVGTLTAHFGVGGSISSLQFEERKSVPQSAIEFSE
jgi:hypothetical protein